MHLLVLIPSLFPHVCIIILTSFVYYWRFVDFSLFFFFFYILSPSGSNSTDSCVFIKKNELGQYAFRQFNPTRTRMRSAEVLRDGLTRNPAEILGFIPFNYDANPTVSVRTEIFYFMKGHYNPFFFPADRFLSYDRRLHDFLYSGHGYDISRI